MQNCLKITLSSGNTNLAILLTVNIYVHNYAAILPDITSIRRQLCIKIFRINLLIFQFDK